MISADVMMAVLGGCQCCCKSLPSVKVVADAADTGVESLFPFIHNLALSAFLLALPGSSVLGQAIHQRK